MPQSGSPAMILVTGGAGYIGSHVCLALAAAGWQPVVYDDLSGGHDWAVQWGPLVRGDITDAAALDAALAHYRPAAVIHLAGLIVASESVAQPARYHQANVTGTQVLLDAMQRHGIDRIVFSSTAAVYGEPQAAPIREDHPLVPINPYGDSKRRAEALLADHARNSGLRSVSLRYFNAAGADPEGRIGEAHPLETHLIPLVLGAAAGRLPPVKLYGTDYPTRDGSCLRDYVHVCDLADAHVAALDWLAVQPGAAVFNLGSEAGATVREVIACAEAVTGRRVPVEAAARRPGDPAALLADATRARRDLGWQPRRSALSDIVASAWRWECRAACPPRP